MYGYTLTRDPARAGVACLLALAALLFPGLCLGGSLDVEAVVGTVEYRQGTDQPWQTLSDATDPHAEREPASGGALSLPLEIRSGDNAKVVLRQGATSLELKSGAQIALTSDETATASSGTTIHQRAGTVFYRGGPSAELRVATPFLQSASTGAAFVLVATDAASFFTLQTGTVNLTHAGTGEQQTLGSPGEVASASSASTDIVALVQAPKASGNTKRAVPLASDAFDDGPLAGQMMTASLETTFDGASELNSDQGPGLTGDPAEPGGQIDALPGDGDMDSPMPDVGNDDAGNDDPIAGGGDDIVEDGFGDDGLSDGGPGGDDLAGDDLAGDDFGEDNEGPGGSRDPADDDLAGEGPDIGDDDMPDEDAGPVTDGGDDDCEGAFCGGRPPAWDIKKGLGHLKHHFHKHKHGHKHGPGKRD